MNVMNTNFFGAVNVTNAVLPHMRDRREGCVAFIGSRSVFRNQITVRVSAIQCSTVTSSRVLTPRNVNRPGDRFVVCIGRGNRDQLILVDISGPYSASKAAVHCESPSPRNNTRKGCATNFFFSLRGDTFCRDGFFQCQSADRDTGQLQHQVQFASAWRNATPGLRVGSRGNGRRARVACQNSKRRPRTGNGCTCRRRTRGGSCSRSRFIAALVVSWGGLHA